MQRYAWNSEYIRPYESLWMIFSKLTLLNQCPLSNLLTSEEWGIGSKLGSDLMTVIPADVASKLGMDRRQRYFASIQPYLKVGEIKSLTSKNLRICPKCIAEYYHSPIHQLLFIENCPAHDTRLIDHCEECHDKLGPYKLNNKHIGFKQICRKCSKPLFKGHEQNLFENLVDLYKITDESRRFETAANWLIRRRKGCPESNLKIRIEGIGRSKDVINEYIKHIPCFASTAMGESVQTGPDFVYRKYKYVPSIGEDGQNDDEKFSYHISALYRSLRSYIYKKYIKGKHDKCYEAIVKGIPWITSYQEYVGVQICPVVYAYILWRMFFEKIDCPGELHSKAWKRSRNSSTVSGRRPPLIDVAIEVPESKGASSRIFATLAIALFEGFWDVAVERVANKTIMFHPELLQPTVNRTPYFELEVSKRDKSILSLHFFTNISSKKHLTQAHYNLCFKDSIDSILNNMKLQFIGKRSATRQEG